MTEPAQAGGDPFDLADLGVKQARYIRIKDAGVSSLGKDSKGFDLDADPTEKTNLAEDPSMAEVLAQLRSSLEAHMAATDDPRLGE